MKTLLILIFSLTSLSVKADLVDDYDNLAQACRHQIVVAESTRGMQSVCHFSPAIYNKAFDEATKLMSQCAMIFPVNYQQALSSTAINMTALAYSRFPDKKAFCANMVKEFEASFK